MKECPIVSQIIVRGGGAVEREGAGGQGCKEVSPIVILLSLGTKTLSCEFCGPYRPLSKQSRSLAGRNSQDNYHYRAGLCGEFEE